MTDSNTSPLMRLLRKLTDTERNFAHMEGLVRIDAGILSRPRPALSTGNPRLDRLISGPVRDDGSSTCLGLPKGSITTFHSDPKDRALRHLYVTAMIESIESQGGSVAQYGFPKGRGARMPTMEKVIRGALRSLRGGADLVVIFDTEELLPKDGGEGYQKQRIANASLPKLRNWTAKHGAVLLFDNDSHPDPQIGKPNHSSPWGLAQAAHTSLNIYFHSLEDNPTLSYVNLDKNKFSAQKNRCARIPLPDHSDDLEAQKISDLDLSRGKVFWVEDEGTNG